MDDEFEIDLPMPSLNRLANIGHAFAIPWSHELQPLLRGFQSTDIMVQKGPWVDKSPFNQDEAAACTMVYESNGGSCTYREANSTQAQSSSEHLSLGGSVAIGPPFLQGEASGQYDKTVRAKFNGARSSRNGSYRFGRVILDQFPRYSKAARRLLNSKNGQTEFRKLYGDFFIRGYTLGADAGACVTAHFESQSSQEELQVKLTVRILGWSKSKEHKESTQSSEVSGALSLCGYSTLKGASESLETKSASASDQAKLGAAAAKYNALVDQLESDVKKSMQELNLKEGARIPASQAFSLCRSGLVVQLLLFPYALTQDYIDCISLGPGP